MKAKTITKSQFAIPFISYSKEEGFFFNPEAEEFIKSIPEQKKIGAVSIVGKYRTGKSFFINRVLLQTKKSGFAVGPTVNPCTKGLWIWKKTLPSKNPAHPDMETLVIDTQGFGGIDETNNHDSRIFLFSLLLSSFFIYNSVGSIDENALNSLNVIINLATSIQKKAGNKFDSSLFPLFLWIVRDFTLQLVDKQNNKLTPSQYLQNALHIQPGTSQGIQNKNKIREQFNKVFPDRDCMTMVIPVDKDTNLQRLDELDNSNLRPQFLNQMQQVQRRIFTKMRPKSINGKQLNSQTFVALIKGYIQIINSGELPTIQNTYVYIRRSECMKAVSESIRSLEGKINQQLMTKGLLDEKQVNQFRNKLEQETYQYFKQKLLHNEQPDPQAFNNLKRKVNELLTQFVERNKRSWLDKYRQLSEKGLQQIRSKLLRQDYKDYNQFIEDFNRIKAEYEQGTGSSAQKWSFFNEGAQSLHRLAGQNIVAKITNNVKIQNEILQKKVQLREDELNNKKRQFDDEKYNLQSRIDDLERQASKISHSQILKQQAIKDLKQQNSRLKQKVSTVQQSIRQKESQVQRLGNQHKKINAIEAEQTKSQLRILKSNLQKQKTLQDMQKQYHEKQIQSYKEKVASYQAENRRLKSNNNSLTNDVEDLRSRLEDKQQKQIQDEQLIQTFKQKIEYLNVQNTKKSEMVNDHSDWAIERTHLENQVTFLKNSLNENKRLHDALLVALQQSVSTSDNDGSNSLVETNKNLSAAMEKLQARCRLLQQQSDKLKRFKKIVKNCTSLQCLHCRGWISNSMFAQHLMTCASESPQINHKQNSSIVQLSGLHISINQTVINQIEENKPFTQYLIQIAYYQKKWTVSQKFKNFCKLNQILVQQFPNFKLPESSSAIINVRTDINQRINSNRTTIAVEQKRRGLQQLMRDLAKFDVIRNSHPYRQFIQFDEHINCQQESQHFTKSSQKIYNKQMGSSLAGTKKSSNTKMSMNSHSELKTKKR